MFIALFFPLFYRLEDFQSKQLGRKWTLKISKINNMDLLYSTGNYIQYLVINYNGKEFFKKDIDIYICICITKSLYCTPETNTIL